MFFFIALGLLLWLAQKISLSIDLSLLHFDYYPSKYLLEKEERFTLTSIIKNESHRFINYLKIKEKIQDSSRIEKPLLTKEYSLFLLSNRQAIREEEMSFSKRGRYIFRGAEISSGDFLGIRTIKKDIHLVREVVIMPSLSQSSYLHEELGGFLGDILARRFILEDPILMTGAREYTGREPFNQISWIQSAKTGELMVSEYDYTKEPSLTVVLNVEGLENSEALFEKIFSFTRTICHELKEKSFSYDFMSNANTSSAVSTWSYIPESSGNNHYYSIIEGISRANYYERKPFYHLLDDMKNIGDDRFVVLISQELNKKEKEKLEEIKRKKNLTLLFLSPREEE